MLQKLFREGKFFLSLFLRKSENGSWHELNMQIVLLEFLEAQNTVPSKKKEKKEAQNTG